MGGNNNNNNGGSHLPNITVKPIDVPTATSTTPTNPPAQAHSSLLHNQLTSSHTPAPATHTQTPIKPPQSAPLIPSDQCPTVRFKSLPLHLTPLQLQPTSTDASSPKSVDYLETSIQRWVQVDVDKLDLIHLSSDEKNPGPIFIEAPNLDEFLPGDQLIAIEDFSMIGKSFIFLF